MTAPRSVTVGRLSLHAGEMSEADARRLAELIGLALGRIPVYSADAVAVTVAPQPGRSVEQLADVVANAIENALRTEAGR